MERAYGARREMPRPSTRARPSLRREQLVGDERVQLVLGTVDTGPLTRVDEGQHRLLTAEVMGLRRRFSVRQWLEVDHVLLLRRVQVHYTLGLPRCQGVKPLLPPIGH